MVQRLHYVLVSPEKKVADEYVLSITLPAFEGLIQVLPQHAPTLVLLSAGFIKLETSSGEISHFISGGYADISEKVVTVLAEEAMMASDFSAEHLKRLMQTEKTVLSSSNDIDIKEASRQKLVALEQISI